MTLPILVLCLLLCSAMPALALPQSDDLTTHQHLAKLALQSGDLAAALRHVESLLQYDPQHRGALFIKATALRRSKAWREAIALYQDLLDSEEDFDSRLGLTYALLASGQYSKARENSRGLQPEDAEQMAELEELTQALTGVARPSVAGQYTWYSDADGNQVHAYTLRHTNWLYDWKLDVAYKHTEACEPTKRQQAHEVSVRTATTWPDGISLSAGLGFVQMGDRQLTNPLIGHLKMEMPLGQGSIAASIAREALTSTAQLIDHHVRQTRLGLSLAQPLSQRLSFLAEYHYRLYDDHNDAHDTQWTARYNLLAAEPRLDLGYRLRYLDVARSSRRGYFDAQHLLSQQVYGLFSWEQGRYYGTVEPAFGYQSFERKQQSTAEFFLAGSGTLGLVLAKRLALEVNVEGGLYGLGNPAGFHYYALGAQLTSRF